MLVTQIPITWTAEQVEDFVGTNNTQLKLFREEQESIVRRMAYVKSMFFDNVVPDSISLKEMKAIFFVAGRKGRHPSLDRPIYSSGMAITLTDRLVLFDVLPRSATVPSGPLSVVQFARSERTLDLGDNRFKMGAMDTELPDIILQVYTLFMHWVRDHDTKDIFEIPTNLPNLSYWSGHGDWTFLNG